MKRIIIYTILLSMLASCSVTKNVPDNEKVLYKVKVKVEGEAPGISKGKLMKYVQQKPVRKLFGVPVYAYVYNIPNPKKDSKRLAKKEKKLDKKNRKIEHKYDIRTARLQAKRNKYQVLYKTSVEKNDTAKAKKYYEKYYEYEHKVSYRKKVRPTELEAKKKNDILTWWEFLRKIGERPPIYNPQLTQKTEEQFKYYLQSQGYYHPQIEAKEKIKNKKKLELIYIVKPGKPLIIDSVEYDIADTAIRRIILSQEKLQLKTGGRLSIKTLQDHRNTINNYLKDRGYYAFDKNYITYAIDTTGRQNKAKVYVKIDLATDENGNKVPHKIYKIKNVYVFSDYNPNKALENTEDFYKNTDTTIVYNSDSLPYYFIKKNQYVIKPKILIKQIYITPNSTYNFSSIRNTYLHLSKYAIYKLINIQIDPIDSTDNLLNCNILLTPGPPMSITTEIEGTNSSGNIGGAVNLIFSHRNLFHGGEFFSLKLHSALETQKIFGETTTDFGLFNTKEFSIEGQLVFPRILSPFKPGRFTERSNPKTEIFLSFNYQDRPEYNKIDLTHTWSYRWKGNDFVTHFFTPVRISSVRILDILPEFYQWIQSTYLATSYEDHFIISSAYSFTFTDQSRNRPNYIYFQLNLESAGNALYGIMNALDAPKVGDSYVIPGFNTVFAQFVKADFDFRFYHIFPNRSQFVWRLFSGAGIPYKNSKLLPFGERYFAGGANSIRAWQVRTLGPGTYKLPEDIIYPNQTADIKLETNFEYRYPLIWKLEGAMFVDIGNIWAANKYDNRPGALFEWNTFYKELAVGSGTGIRLNLDFFIARVDIGVKLRDPSAPEGQRFIPTSRPYTRQDFAINVAIGYPF